MMLRATVAAILIAVTYVLQLPLTLGAHPFWANEVILVGGSIGFLLALAPLPRPSWAKALALLAVAGAAFGLATYGKSQFAASYAEDTAAGQLWYFGWHVVCACFVAGLATAAPLAWSLRRH